MFFQLEVHILFTFTSVKSSSESSEIEIAFGMKETCKSIPLDISSCSTPKS